jgi:5-methylcytosine-specific restriction endonuclease McrA
MMLEMMNEMGQMGQELVVFEEGGVLQEIVKLHSEIIDHLKMSVEKGIRVGELLLLQKERLIHGEWTPWAEENLPFSYRTASNYMMLFKERYKVRRGSVTGLSEAYLLLRQGFRGRSEEAEREHNRKMMRAQGDAYLEYKLNLLWSMVRQDILDRDGYQCQFCSKHSGGKGSLHIHHILKRKEGGASFYDQLLTVCNSCHTKADRTLYDPDWYTDLDKNLLECSAFLRFTKWLGMEPPADIYTGPNRIGGDDDGAY